MKIKIHSRPQPPLLPPPRRLCRRYGRQGLRCCPRRYLELDRLLRRCPRWRRLGHHRIHADQLHAGPPVNLIAPLNFPFSQNSRSGFLGGGQVGYNWQSGWAVFGVQGDIAGTDIKGTTPCLVILSCTTRDQLAGDRVGPSRRRRAGSRPRLCQGRRCLDEHRSLGQPPGFIAVATAELTSASSDTFGLAAWLRHRVDDHPELDARLSSTTTSNSTRRTRASRSPSVASRSQ